MNEREFKAEILTEALHPEFGTEWREPDGIIWQAVQQAKEEAYAEGYADAIDHYGCDAPWGGSIPLHNPYSTDRNE